MGIVQLIPEDSLTTFQVESFPPEQNTLPGGESVVVNFRSDNAFMTTTEIIAKQRKARDLQEILRKQIDEKKEREVGILSNKLSLIPVSTSIRHNPLLAFSIKNLPI